MPKQVAGKVWPVGPGLQTPSLNSLSALTRQPEMTQNTSLEHMYVPFFKTLDVAFALAGLKYKAFPPGGPKLIF